MVRDSRYKLVTYHSTGLGELFDLHAAGTTGLWPRCATTRCWRASTPRCLKRSAPVSEGGLRCRGAQRPEAQFWHHLADENLTSQYPSMRSTGLALVFHGCELEHCRATARQLTLGPSGTAGVRPSLLVGELVSQSQNRYGRVAMSKAIDDIEKFRTRSVTRQLRASMTAVLPPQVRASHLPGIDRRSSRLLLAQLGGASPQGSPAVASALAPQLRGGTAKMNAAQSDNDEDRTSI